MFDSIFNYIIFLIPLAIFIGRAVSNARNRQKPKAPPVPVHFEEEEQEEEDFFGKVASEIKKAEVKKDEARVRGDDEYYPHTLSRGASEYFKGLDPKGKQSAPKAPPPRVPLAKTLHGSGSLAARMSGTEKTRRSSLPPARPRVQRQVTQRVTQGQGLAFLSHLSPLRQAVVMAEVLGPPKGMV